MIAREYIDVMENAKKENSVGEIYRPVAFISRSISFIRFESFFAQKSWWWCWCAVLVCIFLRLCPQFLILRFVRSTPKLRCGWRWMFGTYIEFTMNRSHATNTPIPTFLIRWRDERMLIPFGCVYAGYTVRHSAFVGCWLLYAISHFNDACSRLHEHKSKCTRQSMSSLRLRSRRSDRMICTVRNWCVHLNSVSQCRRASASRYRQHSSNNNNNNICAIDLPPRHVSIEFQNRLHSRCDLHCLAPTPDDWLDHIHQIFISLTSASMLSTAFFFVHFQHSFDGHKSLRRSSHSFPLCTASVRCTYNGRIRLFYCFEKQSYFTFQFSIHHQRALSHTRSINHFHKLKFRKRWSIPVADLFDEHPDPWASVRRQRAHNWHFNCMTRRIANIPNVIRLHCFKWRVERRFECDWTHLLFIIGND